MALTLGSVGAYIERLPLPTDHNLEGKERLLLDMDENVQRVTLIIPQTITFLTPFIQEVSWTIKDGQEKRSLKQVDELTRSLIRILAHPLAYLDLTDVDSNKAKSMSRICAERCINLLGRLQPDFIKTISVLSDTNKSIDRAAESE